MKSAIVIKSFCNSQEKLNVLVDAIEKIRTFSDLPILIHAGWPIPVEIFSKVHFYINYNNSGLTSGDNHRWRGYPNYSGQFRSKAADYGLADIMQLKVCSSFLANFGYETMHIFNYDVDIDQIIETGCFNQNVEILDQGYDVAYQQSKENYAGLLFYSVNINAFNSKIASSITIENWHNEFYRHWPYVAENGFYEVFSRLNSYVTHHNFQLRDLIHTPWLDLDGFNTEIKEYFQEGGLYHAQNGVWVFALTMEKPLTGTIIFDEKESITLTGEPYCTFELIDYPTKVIYRSDDGQEYDLFTEYKLEKMKNNLTYYDPAATV
jgi:hypothetical protein